MDVDFFGIKVPFEDESQAKAFIAARDNRVSEYNDLQTRLGSLEQTANESAAAVKAKEQEAADSAARVSAIEAAKKGDIETAERLLTERLTQQHNTERTAMLGQLKNTSLRSLLASRRDVLPSAVKDAQALIDSQVAIVDGSLYPVGEDGKPNTGANMDDWLGAFLGARPYLRADNVPTQAPTKPSGNPAVTATITRAEYDAAPATHAKGIQSGAISIKD